MTGFLPDCGKNESESSTIELSSFGIREGISEVIVSTGVESPNAAPIGIVVKGGRTFVRLFKGTHTWENVLKEISCCKRSLQLRAFCTFDFSDLELSEFDYVPVHGLNFPVLKEAAAWIVFECVNIKDTDQALVADLIPVKAGFNEANLKSLPVPNRGFNAVLEAAVHATRYQLTGEEKYLELIRRYESLASKCGGESEKKAMKLLYQILDL